MDATSQAQFILSTLLGLSALIPDNVFRYTALGITACLSLTYMIYLRNPSTQLRQLQHMIEKAEALTQGAKLQCPRDQLSPAEEGVRILEVSRSASKIQCRIWETQGLKVNRGEGLHSTNELSLADEGVRILAINQPPSKFRRIWETQRLAWKNYRLLSKDIANCTKQLKSIHTAVQAREFQLLPA
ncbi:hypothetical protein DFH09DRAFT_1308598 [Mycena vulgaris]|nr:hypothetical protein DFH09DRAFT_1308598 [Mycena vulgaris]